WTGGGGGGGQRREFARCVRRQVLRVADAADVVLVIDDARFQRGRLLRQQGRSVGTCRDGYGGVQVEHLELVRGVALVVLLAEGLARPPAGGHEDPGLRAVDPWLPRTLGSGRLPPVVQLSARLAPLPS